MALHQWQPLVSDGSVLALKYSFGFGLANTLAAKMDDGSWLAISPAVGIADAALETLASQGGVSALIAPNGSHHMGQAPWRKRFPNAVSYAAQGALARLASKSPGVAYQPIDELQRKVGDRIAFVEPAGMKAPDLVVRIGGAAGTVWFGGDLISNTSAADMSLLARIGFSLMGGGPGYRFNSVPSMVYLKDKAAWKADVRARMAEHPPVAVLPAHGDAVTADAAALTQAILA